MYGDYRYLDAVKDDVKQYFEDNCSFNDYDGPEDAKEKLYDELWTADEVTGNGSGSYTFDREQAKEYLFNSSDGMDLLKEAVSEYGIEAESIAEHMMSEDWEWFDVTIRCYALGQAIDEAIDELDQNLGMEDDE